MIHRRAPWKTTEAVELAAPIGYIPPAEAEANDHRQLASQATEVAA